MIHSRPWWAGIYAPIGLGILAGFLGYWALTDALPEPPPGPGAGVRGPGEEPLPINGDGVFHFDRSEETGRLRVIPSLGRGHVYVKVEGWDDPRVVCCFFVRRGRSAETAIPPGTYRLKVACGERWYGEKRLFGPDGSYGAITDRIRILARTHYTISLTRSRAGTLKENRIGLKDY
jgi:hypothetical protein